MIFSLFWSPLWLSTKFEYFWVHKFGLFFTPYPGTLLATPYSGKKNHTVKCHFKDLFSKRWDAAAGIKWGRNNHTLLFIIIIVIFFFIRRLTFTAVGVVGCFSFLLSVLFLFHPAENWGWVESKVWESPPRIGFFCVIKIWSRNTDIVTIGFGVTKIRYWDYFDLG